ncbi:ribosome maturation factor RimM [Candidatus Igneacidithiobacillus taiwanensis]|uniref:ribosome maturation factor RimM n=1 Tax=Candidatus Igneacidithiobacillus taiwanensis TaxID=1945924 RepID=UPI00289B4B3A|nr:ribosome maturation factor RimM [Candidatus Igneacidithiobacillus taiwanensis]MCE5360943.1 ribosome maturation factor RimM [Acidithiobacillus sp.]
MSAPPEVESWIPLGRISGLYGVRGAVKVFSYTEDRDGILDYPVWYLGAMRQPYTVLAGTLQAGAVVANLAGVKDRELARTLIGQEIAIPAADLPPLPEGEYYWRDLIGLQVVNRESVLLGRVKNLLETGANDVLVVVDEAGAETLIPWTAEVTVDRVQRQIQVDWDKSW